MTDAMEPQDQSEALDADKIGPEFPLDEPVGVHEREVTPLGDATRESFEERDARHEVEPAEHRPLVQPYQEAGADILDDEAQAVADAEVTSDVPGQSTSEAYGGGGRNPEGDTAPPPAEEAALHIEDS